jgi:hypothetical protein
MSEGGSGDNVIGVRTVYDALLRLEGKVDQMGSRFSEELDEHRSTNADALDAVRTEQTYLKGKIDGSLGVLKWLGPAGVVGVIFAIAKGMNLV